jgi:predicted permease
MYSVTPGYFAVMKIPLKRGRVFGKQDGPSTPRVALLSEAGAREEFPNEDPIGKQIQLGGRDDAKPWITIVGVVGDVRQYALDMAPRLAAYVLQSQDLSFGYSAVVRTSGDPVALENAVRGVFMAADPTLPVYQVRTMESYWGASFAERSFTLTLLGFFGALALGLAALGTYSVISYAVMLRRREMGIRIAVGAGRWHVVATVLRQGAGLGAVGLVVGFLLSLGLTRLLSSLLFEVRPMDAATTAAAAGVLVVVVWAASYFPARRAASMDPIQTLRNE